MWWIGLVSCINTLHQWKFFSQKFAACICKFIPPFSEIDKFLCWDCISFGQYTGYKGGGYNSLLRNCTQTLVSYFDIFWTPPYHLWYAWDIFWISPFLHALHKDIQEKYVFFYPLPCISILDIYVQPLILRGYNLLAIILVIQLDF